jgi:hypothetical protein
MNDFDQKDEEAVCDRNVSFMEENCPVKEWKRRRNRSKEKIFSSFQLRIRNRDDQRRCREREERTNDLKTIGRDRYSSREER